MTPRKTMEDLDLIRAVGSIGDESKTVGRT